MDPTALRSAPIAFSFFQTIQSEPIVLVRLNPGAVSDGEWVPGGEASRVGLPAFVQPATPDEIEMMSEGDRSRQIMHVWIPFPFEDPVFTGPVFADVRIVDEEIGRLADLLLINDVPHEVRKVELFDETDIAHFDLMAVRFEKGNTYP